MKGKSNHCSFTVDELNEGLNIEMIILSTPFDDLKKEPPVKEKAYEQS